MSAVPPDDDSLGSQVEVSPQAREDLLNDGISEHYSQNSDGITMERGYSNSMTDLPPQTVVILVITPPDMPHPEPQASVQLQDSQQTPRPEDKIGRAHV